MGNLAYILRAIWVIVVCLQLIVLATMTMRKLFRDLGTLYLYLCLALCETPVLYAIYSAFGYQSWTAYYAGWISQAVAVAARWFVVCQLCYLMLGQFRGIWGIAWRILAVCGGGVLILAFAVGGHDVRVVVNTLDLALELSMASVLVVFFTFARYYRVQLLPSLRSMGIAFCLYSCFRALNDAILEKLLHGYSSTWNLFDGVTYVATLALIASAVFLLRELPTQSVRLLPAGSYAVFMPQVNDRLSALNDRLSELLNPNKPRTR